MPPSSFEHEAGCFWFSATSNPAVIDGPYRDASHLLHLLFRPGPRGCGRMKVRIGAIQQQPCQVSGPASG